MRFEKIIKQANEQTGRKVVVLVDEYDKPLLGTMDNLASNDAMRDVLKSFYSVLKGADEYLRFVFLTGVTKFSKVSIFSDLNQLQDISMDKEFASICGISETELIGTFRPEIKSLAEEKKLSYEATLAELKKLYDGYHFSENSERIYNPFSLLNTFAKHDFRRYWFATGTPTFLVNMLKAGNFNLPNLEDNVYISVGDVMDYRLDSNAPIPILYQSGYLTIKGYDAEYKVTRYPIPPTDEKL